MTDRRLAGALTTHRGHCRQCLNALLDRRPDQMCEHGTALIARHHGQADVYARCKGCGRGVASVPCETCEAASCGYCRRCPACD